jgi:hypothetical protein
MSNFGKSKLLVNSVESHDYAVRARINAQAGDVTIALSVNSNTPREKIVKETAGKSYISAPFMSDSLKVSRLLLRKLRSNNAKALNITGDTISILANHNFTQEQTNEYVYSILSSVHKIHPIQKILSSGSSGVDLAAAISGIVLGIETIVTAPNDVNLVTLSQIQYGATLLWKSLQASQHKPHKLI